MRRHFQIFLVHCFIIFLCLSIGFLTEPALSEANRETSDYAVTASASLMVTADVLRVRSSPTTESDTLSRLPGGTRVTPLERQLVRNGIESDFGAWFRIEYAEGKEGWVHGNFLRLESGFPENTEYTVFYPFFNHWMISQDVSTIHENIIGLYFIGGYLNGENLLLREKINDLAIDQISEYRERRRLYLERFLRSGLETVILSQNANRIGVARPYEIQIDDGVPSFFGIRAQREMSSAFDSQKESPCISIFPTDGFAPIRFARTRIQSPTLNDIIFEHALQNSSARAAAYAEKRCYEIDVAGRKLFECSGNPGEAQPDAATPIAFLMERSESGWNLLDFTHVSEYGDPIGMSGISCATDLDANGVPELWLSQHGYCGDIIIKRVHLLEHVLFAADERYW